MILSEMNLGNLVSYYVRDGFPFDCESLHGICNVSNSVWK